MTPEQELLYDEILDRGEITIKEAVEELPIFDGAVNAKSKVRNAIAHLVSCQLIIRSGWGKYAPATQISPVVTLESKKSVGIANNPQKALQ